MKHHLIRLDRIAGLVNPWLLVIAIELSLLDFTILIVKYMPAAPVPPAATGAAGHEDTALQAPASQTGDSRS
jgi:hypothetical protein